MDEWTDGSFHKFYTCFVCFFFAFFLFVKIDCFHHSQFSLCVCHHIISYHIISSTTFIILITNFTLPPPHSSSCHIAHEMIEHSIRSFTQFNSPRTNATVYLWYLSGRILDDKSYESDIINIRDRRHAGVHGCVVASVRSTVRV